jgi:hypothetical protein
MPQPGPRNNVNSICRENVTIEPVVPIPSGIDPIEVTFPSETVRDFGIQIDWKESQPILDFIRQDRIEQVEVPVTIYENIPHSHFNVMDINIQHMAS